MLGEDHAVCERLQGTAPWMRGSPRLGLQEERIAWFEEAYAEAVADDGGEPTA